MTHANTHADHAPISMRLVLAVAPVSRAWQTWDPVTGPQVPQSWTETAVW